MERVMRRVVLGLALASLAALSGVGTGVGAEERAAARKPSRELVSRKALVVGASAYQKSAPLRYACDDARAFAEFIKKQWGYPEAGIVLMTDDAADPSLRPTLASLRAQAKTLIESITKRTEVVVYFSGYGARQAREEWLLPLDADPGNVPGTSFSSDRLVTDLIGRKPKRALLFLDADRNVSVSREPRTEPKAFRSAPRGTELGVIYSCEAGERSRPVKADAQPRGVFTHYLLQGLSGDREAAQPDGSITFDALRKYVYGKVRQYVSKEYADAQSPYGISTNAEMVLGKAPAK